MDPKAACAFVEKQWESSVLPSLSDYIRVPNQSPQFDPEWDTNGLQMKAIDVLVNWVKSQNIDGLKVSVEKDEGRTPVILMVHEGSNKDEKETVLIYGHMDKQPPLTEFWDQGLHPHEPVVRGDKLYGRGGADDGYSIFAAVSALKLLIEQKQPFSRLVFLIEACEESGSRDLQYYIEKFADVVKIPSLVCCLDSGCGDYEHLWLTRSLRGMLLATLSVEVLKEGVHSGTASGIVPSSFRILRQLLDRFEDSQTGEIKVKSFYSEISESDKKAAENVAKILGNSIYTKFPFINENSKPVTDSLPDLLLNSTWKPQLAITGVDGMPALASAGNVLRPVTSIKMSIRLPPNLNPEKAVEEMTQLFTTNVPFGAKVTLSVEKAQKGFCAPDHEPWLAKSVETAAKTYWNGNDLCMWGEGGSIPFMAMLTEKFPKTQFIVTGLLGPGSNAHGPNEFLHIPMFKKLVCAVSQILADHYAAKH